MAIQKLHQYPSIIHLLFLALMFSIMKDSATARIQMSLHSQKLEANVKEYRWRRFLIGSVAPRCTYNECRGCKYKCRAEQVPVEGNDPINSAYHYKCVCHS